MSEAISVFSAIIGLAGVLYQIKRSSEQRARVIVEKFEDELKDFVNNVLGWYNQIISFSLPLIEDLKLGQLPRRRQQEYVKLLNTIKQSDVYFSKCELFIEEALDYFERKQAIKNPRIRSLIENLKFSYRKFSRLVFCHKDKLGYLLWQWDHITPSRRKVEVSQIENDLKHIEVYKDAVVQVLGIRLKK